MRRWIWLAILSLSMIYASYRIWNATHPKPEYELESSVTSPSGRWRAEHYLGWVQLGFSVEVWREIRLTDQLNLSTTKMLRFTSGPVTMRWSDDFTLAVRAENTILISTRINQNSDIKIQLAFEPDDPQARRQRLIEHKIPKEDWWMYDIPLD